MGQPSVTTLIPARSGLHHVCSCGCVEPHEIARRVTSDNVAVLLWSDGNVTDRARCYPRGVGAPQTRYSSEIARRSNEALKEDICLMTWAEFARMVKTVRKLLANGRWGRDRDAVTYAFQTTLAKPAATSGELSS